VPAYKDEQPRKRQKVAPVNGDTAYDQGIEIINGLQDLDKLMGIPLSDLNNKYQQAINFFYDAAEIYSAAHQHRNVKSTYQEMAKNCELFIADKIVDLADRKISLGEKTHAVHYLELACSYYEMAISLLEPDINSLTLYWSCLYTLELRMKIMPESRKLYGDKIKEFIDHHELMPKVRSVSVQAQANTELLRSYVRLAQSGNHLSENNGFIHDSQSTVQNIEELNQQRKAITRGIIDSALRAQEVSPEFLNDFEESIKAFTNEIAGHLNIKSIGDCVAKIAMIYGSNYNEIRWAGGREGIKIIDKANQEFNELALLLGNTQINSFLLNNSTQTPRVKLFQAPAYQYDLNYQKRDIAWRILQNPAGYFAELLSKHINSINRSIPYKAEKMISILLFQLGKKIANRQIRDLPETAGLLLVVAAEKHGNIEAAQWLRELEARPVLRT
jgi:hypothetical protein